MRIRSLSLENFKRQNVTERLSGRDLFIGPNGVGKSARIQALGTALLGYVPGAPGRRPQDTFRVATGDTMAVGIDTEALSVIRSFEQKTKRKRDGSIETSITQEIILSPAGGENTLAEKEARIAREFGNFPVMLDFGQFLSLSDTERRAFFYGLAGAGGNEWTRERVEAQLREALIPEDLEQRNPDAYHARDQVIHGVLGEWRDGLDPEAGVQAMLEAAKARQKHWNAEARKAAGAVQKLAELKRDLTETDRGIAENRETLERLQAELTEVASEIARQQAVARAEEKRRARMAELRDQITRLSTPEAFDRAAVERQIAEVDGQIVNPETGEAAAIAQKIRALEEQVERLAGELDATRREAAVEQSRADGLARTVEQASERGGICVIAANISCPKDFTPYVAWAKEEQEKHLAAAQGAEHRAGELELQRSALRSQIATLQQSREQIYQAAQEQERKNRAAHHRILELRRTIEEFETRERLRRERLADATAELARLEAEPDAPIAEVELLEKQRAALADQIQALKAKLQEQERARTTISNMQASMIDSTTAEEMHAACKYLAEALGPKGIQGEMLVGALDPIRDEITANLRTMGVDREFFFETKSARGQEVFRFGWIDDEERPVDFDALSTGQQIMVLAAMLVAILERANPPCKVLAVDNVEHLDEDNFARVIAGLDALSDRLDNILLAGVVTVDELPGWTVHRLGVSEEVAVA